MQLHRNSGFFHSDLTVVHPSCGPNWEAEQEGIKGQCLGSLNQAALDQLDPQACPELLHPPKQTFQPVHECKCCFLEMQLCTVPNPSLSCRGKGFI